MFPGATRANSAKHHDCCEPFADFLSAGKLKQHCGSGLGCARYVPPYTGL